MASPIIHLADMREGGGRERERERERGRFALVDTSTTCLFMPCMAEDSPGVPVIWIGVLLEAILCPLQSTIHMYALKAFTTCI